MRKRYALLSFSNLGWVVAEEADTLLDLIKGRERLLEHRYCGGAMIVEVIPVLEAYKLAAEEAALEAKE